MYTYRVDCILSFRIFSPAIPKSDHMYGHNTPPDEDYVTDSCASEDADADAVMLLTAHTRSTVPLRSRCL